MPDSSDVSQSLSQFLILVLGAYGLLACGLLACGSPARSAAPGYEIVGKDLEPFRSAFNAASDHVRAVLLVGPT
jgi:hypothetical protein